MSYQYLTTQAELASYLKSIQNVSWIALDTEFVSDGKYRPELCLIQVATRFGFALIDAVQIKDTESFWQRICDKKTLIIVHSGRCELEFCFRFTGRIPKNVFDVQLAAGFIGLGYPLNFKMLTEKVLHIQLAKSETRSDWQNRPLSPHQLEYAIQDVCHLRTIAILMTRQLERMGRFSWFEEETRQMLNSIVSVSPDERWRNMAGINRFSRRELAIVRELWNWREARAIEKNQPFNRIIRDDLLLELAKRKSADPHRIVAIRGMDGHHFSGSFLVELGNRIRYALSLSDNDLPPYSITRSYPQYTAAVQFFMMILGQFANKKNIPIKLLASSQDVRNFIAWTEGTLPDGVTCRLLDGWRAELAGELLKNLLNGQIGVSLSRNLEENPLRLIICKRHKKV